MSSDPAQEEAESTGTGRALSIRGSWQLASPSSRSGGIASDTRTKSGPLTKTSVMFAKDPFVLVSEAIPPDREDGDASCHEPRIDSARPALYFPYQLIIYFGN